MAVQWGYNTLGPGQAFTWYFVRPNTPGFLPVLSVIPLSSSFTNPGELYAMESLDELSFPTGNQLGVSTLWSQLSDDGTNLIYYLMVMNFSQNTVAYTFVETDV